MEIREIAAVQFAAEKKRALERDREVSVSRQFAAPPELVWQAITDPGQPCVRISGNASGLGERTCRK